MKILSKNKKLMAQALRLRSPQCRAPCVQALRCEAGQAAIEMTIAFVAIIILLLGTVKIFTWFNQCLVERQQAYQQLRAGEPFVEPPKLDIFNEGK